MTTVSPKLEQRKPTARTAAATRKEQINHLHMEGEMAETMEGAMAVVTVVMEAKISAESNGKEVEPKSIIRNKKADIN